MVARGGSRGRYRDERMFESTVDSSQRGADVVEGKMSSVRSYLSNSFEIMVKGNRSTTQLQILTSALAGTLLTSPASESCGSVSTVSPAKGGNLVVILISAGLRNEYYSSSTAL